MSRGDEVEGLRRVGVRERWDCCGGAMSTLGVIEV